VRFFLNLEKEDEEHNAVAEATRILHLTYTLQSVQVEYMLRQYWRTTKRVII